MQKQSSKVRARADTRGYRYTCLPDRDAHGNYWFGDDHKVGPAIFQYRFLDRPDCVLVATQNWSVWLGPVRGFLTDQGMIRLFYESPERALEALNEAVG